MTAVVYTGAVAPEAYVLNLTPAAGVDLSTVASAELEVKDKEGTLTVWTATKSNQSTTTLRLTHIFIAGDLTKAGIYSVYAKLTLTGGGVLRSKPQPLFVRDRFDTTP